MKKPVKANFLAELPEGPVTINVDTVSAYIEQHRLQPDAKGNVHFTAAMIREMVRLDRAAGNPPLDASEVAEVLAVSRGEIVNSDWERVESIADIERIQARPPKPKQ